MKVLILNNLYPPFAKGGAESAVLAQARHLCDEGHEVHVMTAVPWREVSTSFLEQVRVEDGITVHRYAPLAIWSYYHLQRLPFPLRLLWHAIDLIEPFGYLLLRRLITSLQPDVVYTHNVKGMGMHVVRAARFAKRHVHVLHDVQLITPSGLIWYGKETRWDVQGSLARWYRSVCQRIFRSVQEVEAPSQWIIDFHRSFGFFEQARCTKIVPTPVIISSQVTKSVRRFLFVGQLEVHKGVLFLLELWKQYVAMHPDATLTIVGDGSIMMKVREGAGERVTITGRLSPKELWLVYAAHDVLLVPSLVYENAPSVIGEAHAHGLRVLASCIGGIPELLLGDDQLLAPGNQQVWLSALGLDSQV